MGELGDTLYESNSDSQTKIVTLTGAGDFFSSGADLNNWRRDRAGGVNELKENSRKYAL